MMRHRGAEMEHRSQSVSQVLHLFLFLRRVAIRSFCENYITAAPMTQPGSSAGVLRPDGASG